MYRVYINDGYIISIAHDVTDGNITEEQYSAIKKVIDNKPIAPIGYDYRLKDDLVWELYELPPIVADIEE